MSALKLSGALPAELANGVSDAMHAALSKGMETDEAACIAISVIADYARAEYGDGYLQALASLLLARRGQPLPWSASP